MTYVRLAQKDTVLFGRRVMLSNALTEDLYKRKQLEKLSFFSIWSSRSTHKKYSLYLPFYKNQYRLGIYGCNWGLYKQQLIEVNGFDEDYQNASVGEDNDIEWRLHRKGLRVRSVRYAAIVYHLYHEPNYNYDDNRIGCELMAAKMAAGLLFCKNGLTKQ